MISKCANPACPALFRYLHEGRLFLLECPGGPEMNASAHDGEFVGAPHVVRCFWLCSTCCRTMTLVPKGKGVETVPAETPDCCRTLAA